MCHGQSHTPPRVARLPRPLSRVMSPVGTMWWRGGRGPDPPGVDSSQEDVQIDCEYGRTRTAPGRDKRTSALLGGGRAANCFGRCRSSPARTEGGQSTVEQREPSRPLPRWPSLVPRPLSLPSESRWASVVEPVREQRPELVSFSQEASAGLSPPVDTAMVTAPSRWTAGRMNSSVPVVGTVHPRPGGVGLRHATGTVDRRVALTVMTSRKPATSPTPVGPALDACQRGGQGGASPSLTSGAITLTPGPAGEQAPHLRRPPARRRPRGRVGSPS